MGKGPGAEMSLLHPGPSSRLQEKAQDERRGGQAMQDSFGSSQGFRLFPNDTGKPLKSYRKGRATCFQNDHSDFACRMDRGTSQKIFTWVA